MSPFIQNVVSSIVAGIIVSLSVYFLSKRFKKKFRIKFNKFLGSGITYIYKDQREAIEDIKKCFRKSKNIKIFTIRGSSFVNNHGALKFLIDDLKPYQQLFFLMGNPTVNGESSFIEERAKELYSIDRQKVDTFLSEIKHHKEILLNLSKEKNEIHIRFHDSAAVFRLLIFDDEMFILFYSEHSRAKNNQVYCYPSNYEMYKAFDRYFNILWNYK